MAADLIDVIVVGHPDPYWGDRLTIDDVPDTWADGFSVRVLPDDQDLDLELAAAMPHVIVSFGDTAQLPVLAGQNLEIRRRWISYPEPGVEPSVVANAVLHAFVDVTTRSRFPELPLVSVFTPTYRTGDLIIRAYRSLKAQWYDNWEWVVYDDSPDTETFDLVSSLARADHRIKLFRADRPSGVIGEVKRRCCGLASGSVLVELDHDDELTPNCLDDVVTALATFPDAGFVYTDCAEVFDDGSNHAYGDTFAFGHGSYRHEFHHGREYFVTNYPPIDAKTVRHIVGMPNHVRAWTAAAYRDCGGHAPDVHIADDYELCLRTFLTTEMVHVRRLGYVQYLGQSGRNTQFVRNREIQRLVGLFAARYEPEIHDRFVELGVDDYIWTPDGLRWDTPDPDPLPIANHVHLPAPAQPLPIEESP
jgi:glycosyltransferase involved in cell wall biosynthesis